MNNSYSVEEVAQIIGVKASTIKKYYLLLEGRGRSYYFKRNNQGRLNFSNDDIDLFKRLISLKNKPESNLSKAADEILKEKGLRSSREINESLLYISSSFRRVKKSYGWSLKKKNCRQWNSKLKV